MVESCLVCGNSCYNDFPDGTRQLVCNDITPLIINPDKSACENFIYISEAVEKEGTFEYETRQKQRAVHQQTFGDNPFAYHSCGSLEAAIRRYSEKLHSDIIPIIVKEYEKEMEAEKIRFFKSPLAYEDYQISMLEVNHDRLAEKLIAFSKIIDVNPIETATKTSPFLAERVKKNLKYIEKRDKGKKKKAYRIPK